MATLGLAGPWDLTLEQIDLNLPKKAPGNYALGNVDPKDNKFVVCYVGRSDNDLAGRLKNHLGKFPKFKARYTNTSTEAFLKECENFHDFNRQRDQIHPARCEGEETQCPRCNTFLEGTFMEDV